MKRIAVEIFRENAARFVTRVRRTGQPVIITRDGDELARLVPARRGPWRRILEFFGFVRKTAKSASRRTSWGVYLKMR